MTEQEFNMLMNKIDVILAIIGDDKFFSFAEAGAI